MKLLVGLGNPGRKYALNRHNIGMMAVDRIAINANVTGWRNRFTGSLAETAMTGTKVLLFKPETYMNKSGSAVGAVRDYFRLDSGDIIVLHDEIDLVPGKVRVKSGGGHAGHNGLRSIMSHTGPDFVRVRLGIGHPGHRDMVQRHVLGDFTRNERETWLEDLLESVARHSQMLVGADQPGFMNALARDMGSSTRHPVDDAKPDQPDSTGQDAASWQDRLRNLFGLGR